jgi:protoheme IX farnesyltransferase
MPTPKESSLIAGHRPAITREMNRPMGLQWGRAILLQVWWYFQLTKPLIMLLVLASGATAVLLEGNILSHPLRLALFLLGLYLTGGGANALNQYFERDIDNAMSRTKSRRPLPLGRIRPRAALTFALIIGVGGIAILGLAFNLLVAGMALGTMFFYVVIYTLLLKPHTPYNIVLGGIAGAMVPVGAWAAVTGSTTLIPWILFGIIFLWTPPHFWALALYHRDDYRRTGQPMLPAVRAGDTVLRQILYYSLAMVGVSFAYVPAGGGWFYTVSAGVLGAVFIYKAWAALRLRDEHTVRGIFRYSIFYLFVLLAAMVIDKMAF